MVPDGSDQSVDPQRHAGQRRRRQADLDHRGRGPFSRPRRRRYRRAGPGDHPGRRGGEVNTVDRGGFLLHLPGQRRRSGLLRAPQCRREPEAGLGGAGGGPGLNGRSAGLTTAPAGQYVRTSRQRRRSLRTWLGPLVAGGERSGPRRPGARVGRARRGCVSTRLARTRRCVPPTGR